MPCSPLTTPMQSHDPTKCGVTEKTPMSAHPCASPHARALELLARRVSPPKNGQRAPAFSGALDLRAQSRRQHVER